MARAEQVGHEKQVEEDALRAGGWLVGGWWLVAVAWAEQVGH